VLAYVRSFLGYPTHVIESGLMEAVRLVGKEWYSIAGIANVSSRYWERLPADSKAQLIRVLAFHLPHARGEIVERFQQQKVWRLIKQDVMRERNGQSEKLRDAFSID